MSRHLRIALIALLLLTLVPVHPPVATATDAPPPPLPRGCGRGSAAIDDYATAICCVSGYVYVNGVPIEGAEVTLTLGSRSVTLQTWRDFGTNQPYYFARLDSNDWLNARPGDEITIIARANGQSVTDTFIAHEGGQQMDLVLPRVSVDALWARADLPPRTGFSLAYDQARDRLVLFGGLDPETNQPRNDTWEFDGVSWIQRTPPDAPDPRFAQVMVYDTARQRVVLFGGYSDVAGWSYSDTWEWDGVNWLLAAQQYAGPTARGRQSMAYDVARERVVMFGGYLQCSGYGCTPGYLDDTWEWDGQTWTEHTSTPFPQGRENSAMTYDPVRERVVMFGGWNESAYAYLSDTWEWNGTTWTRRTPITSPTGREGHALVYDPVRGRVVMFGGYRRTDGNRYFQETWEWTGMTWAQQTPTTAPPARYEPGAVYDSANNQVVIFSGRDGTSIFADMWQYDGTTWSQRTNSQAPPVRLRTALEYEHTGTTLLFGGYDYVSAVATTHRWTGNGWLRLTPATTPPGRYYHRLARTSAGSQLLMFGGIGVSGGYLDDTWLWDGTDWQQATPARHPSARADYSLTYDQQRDVWVLFGGDDKNGLLGDTWEFNGTDWTQRSFSTSPAARSGATLTYDAGRNVAVLVGGTGSAGPLDDVWEYDGNIWQNVTPAQRLAARSGHSTIYDSKRQMVVVAGGMDNHGVFADTWEWNGSYWRQRITTPSLPDLHHFGMAYDVQHDRMVATGGEDAGGVVRGTYVHQVIGTPTEAPPIATINRLLPRDARQGSDTMIFEGRGADADSSNVISAYRWSYLQDGKQPVVFDTQPSLSRPATDFPVGMGTIRFEVQDNEGTWSQPMEETIYIRKADGGTREEGTTWTLLIYAAADNNLNPWMGLNPESSGMLYRLKHAGPQDRVQVALLYDGAGIDDTRRYILTSTGAWTEQSLPEARMDEMETLRDFITWGYTTFPTSDHYVLSLVDHANGVVGFAEDSNSPAPDGKPFLTPLELRSALEQATDNGARKIDVLHYDGCSFGLYETAAIADGLAHYVIASPTTAWGIFAYDQYRVHTGNAASPRAYATAVAATYADHASSWDVAYTISVFDMAQFDRLDTRISAFGDALLAYVTADRTRRMEEVRSVRDAAQKYDSGGLRSVDLDVEDAYVDIINLAERVRAQVDDSDVDAAANALIDAVQGNTSDGIPPFVIDELHATHSYTVFDTNSKKNVTFVVNLDHAHGIGLFYPPRSAMDTNSAYLAYIQHQLFHVTRDNGWTRFIANGIPPQLGDDVPAMPNDILMSPLVPGNVNSEPTPEPTAEPTIAPTVEPTAEPTIAPTPSPTVVPTTGPDINPTQRQQVFLPLVQR